MQYKLVKPITRGRPSRYWYIYWTEGYRSKRRSTGCETREDAERFLAEYVAERSRPPERLYINDLIDAHIEDLKERNARSVDRIDSHHNANRKAFGRLEPETLHEKLFIDQFNIWRSGGTSDGTIRTRCLHLRAALNLAVRREWIDKAPHVPAPAPGEERTRYLSRAEFERLYAGAEEIHIRTFLALGVYTGMRNGSILDLKWSNIDTASMIVRPEGGTANKRRAPVPINTPLALALGTAWINRDGPFVVHWRGKKVGSAKTGFHAAVRRAGLEDVNIHDLRRTCASWLAIGGVSMDRIAKVLGDTVAVTERHYAHLSPDYLRDEMDVLG